MADNVPITPGAGATVATDDVAGVHYQRVKLVNGTLDDATAIPGGANGLKVDLTSTGANATALKVDGSAVTQPVSDGGATLSIDDGAGSITVDGALTSVATITNVVHVDDNASTLSVDDGGGSLTVDGAVTADTELTTADLDTGAGTDTRAVVGLVGSKSGGGVLIPGDATKGLAVDLTATGANATAIKVDGSAVTQPVSGSLAISANVTSIQTQTSGLTTSVTAYSAGDQLGAEMSFASAAASAGGTFTIVSATLTDAAKIVGSADLFLFDQSGVTHAGDNAANAWSDADILKCLGVISFPPPIFSANNAIATVPVVGLGGKLASGTTLYGVLVTRVGHTFFGAATDLAVRLLIQRD